MLGVQNNCLMLLSNALFDLFLKILYCFFCLACCIYYLVNNMWVVVFDEVSQKVERPIRLENRHGEYMEYVVGVMVGTGGGLVFNGNPV